MDVANLETVSFIYPIMLISGGFIHVHRLRWHKWNGETTNFEPNDDNVSRRQSP